MTHPKQTLRFDWHSSPDVACLPGHSERSLSGDVPASPSLPTRSVWRSSIGLSNERKLAVLLTVAVWTVLASIAEIIRLAEPLTSTF